MPKFLAGYVLKKIHRATIFALSRLRRHFLRKPIWRWSDYKMCFQPSFYTKKIHMLPLQKKTPLQIHLSVCWRQNLLYHFFSSTPEYCHTRVLGPPSAFWRGDVHRWSVFPVERPVCRAEPAWGLRGSSTRAEVMQAIADGISRSARCSHTPADGGSL